MLGALSRNARALVSMGNIERLRELFAAQPGLAKELQPQGSLLAYLPDDEDVAMDVAELLLANGADPRVKNAHGVDAISNLEKRGLEGVADMLRNAPEGLRHDG